ncbi:Plasmodium exported protein (PHIST), unknown function [Plasmodium gallinaceum]|uniref:Plasmodium RESA N-terminal domain-containing protein n=1 Tax=Plasmodium gallinaceum TaxID=5849 RepID=A0A1J1GNN5_PLAGA|nr:Plasmodium exported protein (PHIST), unknown function [Plasmodium gallinaceum]CRG94066.1 Plasmodium exported protein (PHIST), unknown function [Plasmodium gallinaceum]
MKYSSMQTYILTRKYEKGNNVTLKISTCSPKYQDIIFKKINFRNYMLSRFCLISFLSLFFFFLQDIYKLYMNINLDFQFKNVNSRKLAESNIDKNYDKNYKNSKENVTSDEMLHLWKNHRIEEEKKLVLLLETLMKDLLSKKSHSLDEKKRDELWFKFIEDVRNGVKNTDKKFINDLHFILRDGGCTYEKCVDFIQYGVHIWGAFRYEVKDHWHNKYLNSVK